MAFYLEWNIYTLLLALLGFCTVCYFILDTVWMLLQVTKALLSPYLLNEDNTTLQRYGEWALVTGCTDGIGKEYARELARRGHSIILVSRTEEKLLTTAKEIETSFGVKTKIIQADFAKGPEAINNVRKQVGDLPVAILVNNVGMQYSYPMYVGEVPEDHLWNIINVNCGAVTLLTRIIIEDMIKRNRGAIVNVSSSAELQPLPLMTVYAASKVYIKSFTEALRWEYSDTNLTIQHLSPMFINTKMNEFSNRLRTTSLFVPDAKMYAKYAAGTLGKVDHSTGYWSHGIQYFFTSLSPVWIRTQIGGMLNRSFRKEYFYNNNMR